LRAAAGVLRTHNRAPGQALYGFPSSFGCEKDLIEDKTLS
jgi:hypothetical protein